MIGAIVLIGLYFAPTVVAKFWNPKRNVGAIFAMNLLLGWTIIGWIVALIWSLKVEETPRQHVLALRESERRSLDPTRETGWVCADCFWEWGIPRNVAPDGCPRCGSRRIEHP